MSATYTKKDGLVEFTFTNQKKTYSGIIRKEFLSVESKEKKFFLRFYTDSGEIGCTSYIGSSLKSCKDYINSCIN
jgi:hypothetical protein